MHQTRPQAPLFSPIFSGKAEKMGPSETYQDYMVMKRFVQNKSILTHRRRVDNAAIFNGYPIV